MLVSATYICPVRGLSNLEPPEPKRLGQAAKVAKSIGMARLLLPVLEEALLRTTRAKVHYLDGLIHALDQIGEAKLEAWFIAPAARILSLDFVPPHLVKGAREAKAGQVFVDGKIRNLWPFDWWADPSLIQKRIKLFREIVDAVNGHSALTGWVIMDRALEWARPELEVADLVLKSFLAEIREHDEGRTIYLGLGWSELLDPKMGESLSSQVDGLRMSGLDHRLPGLESPHDLTSELTMAAYLGSIAEWLFGRPIEIEIGWGVLYKAGDMEDIVEATRQLAAQGIVGVNWLSLVDPEPWLHRQPPWVLTSGLERVGLLDRGIEPKGRLEAWLREIRSIEPGKRIEGFIDIRKEEYTRDPHTHLPRLWDHFLE